LRHGFNRSVESLNERSLSDPLRQRCFAKLAGTNHFHGPDRIRKIDSQPIAVVREEKTRSDPSGSFIAVCEAMIPHQPVDIYAAARATASRTGINVKIPRPHQR